MKQEGLIQHYGILEDLKARLVVIFSFQIECRDLGWTPDDEGGDSEISGDGGGVGMARSLSTSASGGRDMEAWEDENKEWGNKLNSRYNPNQVESAGAKCSSSSFSLVLPRPHSSSSASSPRESPFIIIYITSPPSSGIGPIRNQSSVSSFLMAPLDPLLGSELQHIPW
ncbi:hypothetical protein Tco_0499503 [Tanacetum coccineum]